jgi:hypothetical protein
MFLSWSHDHIIVDVTGRLSFSLTTTTVYRKWFLNTITTCFATLLKLVNMSNRSWKDNLGVRKRKAPVDLDTLEFVKLLDSSLCNLILLFLYYSDEQREKLLAKRKKNNASTLKCRYV